MYETVPTQEDMQSKVFSIYPLTPKSAIFTHPFLFIKMLEGFMSLWSIFLTLCKYSIPFNICTVINPIIYSGTFPTSLITSANDPASIYSKAMWTCPSFRNAPYDRTTNSLSHSCRVFSSRRIYFLTFSFDCSGITLSAMIFFVGVCTTFST